MGAGIDIVKVERIKRACANRRFVERVFTRREIEYFQSRNNNPQTVAGTFAAKEAFAKALGCGFGRIGWREVEILHDARGKPYINFCGNARHEVEKLGGKRVWVSISHTREFAVAQVIIEGREGL